MLKQAGISLSLLVIMALLSGISLLFLAGCTDNQADDASAENDDDKDTSGLDITEINNTPPEKREKIYPKLSSILDRLVEAEEHGEAEEFARPRGIELLYDDSGLVSVEVVIECLPEKVEEAAEVVGTYGTVGVVTSRGISAIVPIASLAALADEESIEQIRLPISAEGA